jgi:hypothetical protein
MSARRLKAKGEQMVLFCHLIWRGMVFIRCESL